MSRTKLAVLRIFAWFHVLSVPTLIWGTTDVSNLVRPTGKVSLFSFERGYLRTITDGADTEVVINAPPRYFEAYLFECNATYPVQWAYIGEAAPVVTADVGRFFQDFYDVSTYTYQSILLMYSLQELQSGRYICRGASKEHDKLAIHYDVFVPGNGTQILLSTSEKKLFIPETKEHAYIPCGVSDSTAVVNLYRGNQWGTFYPIPVNGSITFNPRKGFKIRFKDFLDPWGTYLCVSESNKKRRKVHLIPESLKAKYDMINHVSGKIPVYFSYEYEYNRVLCCTGTNFIPKLQWAGCGSILDCQVKSACFEEDRCEQRLGNSGYNPTKWIDPGPLPPGCSGYRLRDDPNGDFGLFKCSTPGVAQYQPYLLNRGNIFLDFEKTPPSEMILTLQRISPEGPSFVGDELEFHCNSTRFYFAYGIRWGWERVSGEIDFIDDAAVIRDKYSIRGHRRRTTLKIPRPDIKSVICFVPVVNSATEWRTVSLPVVIASNDVNFINHQNPVPNNVIDLDSITYHTDYDEKPNPVAVQPQPGANPNPPSSQYHTQNPQQQQQPPNLQVYNSAKTPYQEIQGVVPPASTEEHQHHQNDPNYYSYAHDNSQDIPDTHVLQQNSNDIHSHSSRVRPIAQPLIVDIHSHVQASTPSPSIISISRSKKNRNRPSSGGSVASLSRSDSRSVPNLKPDAHYDTVDKDYGYDTFEPRPSSSSKSNARFQNSRTHSQYSSQDQKIQTSSSRIPYQQHTSSSSHPSSSSSSRRPSSSSSSSSSSRRQNYSQNEFSYSTPKKTYRDYNNYNEKTEFGVDMRLSLPFEPATPPSRIRYAPGSNYSTISASASLPSTSTRVSGSSSKSHSDRSHTRRPVSSHSHSSTRPYHRQENDRHHHSRNQPEKDYTIEDSYSQHVRLNLPANSISTHIPKTEKSSGSRSRSHSHTSHARGRGHSSTNTDHGSSRNRNTEYYYSSEISPVEIKVPHTKSHDPYRTRGRQDPRHHTTSQTSIKDIIEAKPVHHESSSPTTYSRKRPYSSSDHHAYAQATTPQPYYREDTPTHSSHSANNHHQHTHQAHHHSYSNPLSEHHQPKYYHHDSSSGHLENHRSSARHRSYSRGMKFDANGSDTAAAGGALIDAYEYTSPTARPAYFMSTPQSSNEFINADMELKRVQPHQRIRTTTTPPPNQNAHKVKGNSTADILHSVSISISSRVSLDGQSGSPLAGDHAVDHDVVEEKHHNDIQDTAEDYDIYSPQYTNYKPSTVLPPTPKPVVPIQFFVKPTDVSSFQPAKSIIDEEDEYDIG